MYTGGCMALVSERMCGSTVDGRLDHLNQLYLAWAEEKHDKAYMFTISRATLGWPDSSTFPNGQWSKGHVTTSLTAFFLDWATQQDFSDAPLLDRARQAAICISACFEGLYMGDVWLPQDEAKKVAGNGLRFLSLYRELSWRSYHLDKSLFSHMPTGHAMCHIFLALKLSSLLHEYSLSPLVTAVEIDEDYIGKVSRLSRRTNPKQYHLVI
jgi:hypothetical protein